MVKLRRMLSQFALRSLDLTIVHLRENRCLQCSYNAVNGIASVGTPANYTT